MSRIRHLQRRKEWILNAITEEGLAIAACIWMIVICLVDSGAEISGLMEQNITWSVLIKIHNVASK